MEIEIALRVDGAAHRLVVDTRPSNDAHTVLAAGGINAALGALDPEDTWQQHFADTWQEGYSLANPHTVELLTHKAPAAILELAEWGCPFARTPDGRLDQRFFGAHTGRAILTTLLKKVQELGIPIHERQDVSRLLVTPNLGHTIHAKETDHARPADRDIR